MSLDHMKNARKLFRLFKTINEIQKIQVLMADTKMPLHKLILNILCRIGFGIFWIFDNINVLATVKFITADQKSAAKNGARGWLLGLVTGLILAILALIEAAQADSALKNSDEDREKKKQVIELKKFDNVITVIKNLADMVTCTQALEIPKNYLGFQFNDGHCGLGGLTSAILTMYTLYPAPKK
jgi:hypothetical protein